MTKEEADYEAAQGSVDFEYPDDEPTQESTAVDLRKVQLQSLEWATKFILSGRTDTIRHMRASIGLMLLRGETPNVGEIARNSWHGFGK